MKRSRAQTLLDELDDAVHEHQCIDFGAFYERLRVAIEQDTADAEKQKPLRQHGPFAFVQAYPCDLRTLMPDLDRMQVFKECYIVEVPDE